MFAPIQAAAVPQPKPRKPHWAFTAIGIATVLGLCYWGELVLAVMLVSVLLAFILAPVMDLLIRARFPRGLAAAVAVILLLAVLAGLAYYSSSQAIVFGHDLSKYTRRIQQEIYQVRQQAENLGTLDPDGSDKEPSTSHHQFGRPSDTRVSVRYGRRYWQPRSFHSWCISC